MGPPQPFLYNAEWRNDARYPATTFDPKAVTRASWEPKPRRPPQTGPLISFNRHPDAHMILSPQNNHYLPLGRQAKKWIKWLRNVQLLVRILEVNGAIGVLVLLILITNIEDATGWVMRISPGVAMAHCLYAIYHLSRKASGRTPGSSTAYHVFAAISDLVVMSLYAFGAFSTHKSAHEWTTRLANQDLLRYFVPAVYYMTIGVGGLHLVSLSISIWLGIMFRRISLMPPDMNPLEDHLTARPFHKRNKSSITTASSLTDEKRLSTASSSRGRVRSELCADSRPPVVPFLHTRTGSSYSIASRGSYVDLPSRQYQIEPGNSPRSSVYSLPEKRFPVPRSSQLGLYSSIPSSETQSPPRRPANTDETKGRPGKFTETWMPTDSLISRTNQRNFNMTGVAPNPNCTAPVSKPYTALVQAFDEYDSSESDYGDENEAAYNQPKSSGTPGKHPNPLRSHPTSPPQGSHAMPTRLDRDTGNSAREHYQSLSELSGNSRRVSDSRDITDREPDLRTPWRRDRDSSIQLEDGFYSKPYGKLRSATPPIAIGSDRKLSSGVDYGFAYSGGVSGRRNVSGKVAEEGRGFR